MDGRRRVGWSVGWWRGGLLGLLLTGGLSSTATALTEGEEPGVGGRIEVRRGARISCAERGGICLRAVAPSTRAVESAPVVAAGSSGVVPTARRFMRARRIAAAAGPAAVGAVDASSPWVLDFEAHLRQPAFAGNALFIVYDAEDRRAIAAHEVTTLFQARIPAGHTLSVRLTLSTADGIRAGGSYRIQVVQLINSREHVLAEGDVTLL